MFYASASLQHLEYVMNDELKLVLSIYCITNKLSIKYHFYVLFDLALILTWNEQTTPHVFAKCDTISLTLTDVIKHAENNTVLCDLLKCIFKLINNSEVKEIYNY